MSSILYYSKNCPHSSKIITKLSKSDIKKEIHFVCIDKRIKRGNKLYIILNNNKEILLPETITKVPSLLLLYQSYRVLTGDEILKYFEPKIAANVGIATNKNMEPISFSMNEIGFQMSDTYSFLDQTDEELSAKGDGGLRQIHSFSTINNNVTIETPPEDYIPDKVRETDLEKLQKERNKLMKKNQRSI